MAGSEVRGQRSAGCSVEETAWLVAAQVTLSGSADAQEAPGGRLIHRVSMWRVRNIECV